MQGETWEWTNAYVTPGDFVTRALSSEHCGVLVHHAPWDVSDAHQAAIKALPDMVSALHAITELSDPADMRRQARRALAKAGQYFPK